MTRSHKVVFSVAWLGFCLSLSGGVHADVRDHESATRLVDRGIKELQSEDLATVLTTFSRAANADDRHALALALRGAARAAYTYYGYANRKCEGLPPPHLAPESQDLRRYESAHRDSMKDALRDVENAVALDRVDDKVLVLRGYVYLLRSDVEGPLNLDKAISDFTQAIVLNSKNADAHLLRAWAYDKQVSRKDQVRVFGMMNFSDRGTAEQRITRENLTNVSVIRAVALLQKEHDDMEMWSSAPNAPSFFERVRSPYFGGLMGTSDPAKWHTFMLTIDADNRHTPKGIYEKAKNAVVYLVVDRGDESEWTCTGFFPGNLPLIMTNAHVVKKAKNNQVTVEFRDGRRVTGAVFAVDENRDLALIKVDNSVKHYDLTELARLAGVAYTTEGIFTSKPAAVGTPVVAIGHPKHLDWTMTFGVISAHRTPQTYIDLDGQQSYKGVLLLQTDTAINNGNSGGPVFNLNGEIAGVVSSSVPGEGLHFIISAKDAEAFIQPYKYGHD
jgi:S1-C subfamily serine protease